MARSVEIHLKVNGRNYVGHCESRTQMADFLRENLNLTGTHVGCEHGVCGVCTILVNGEAVRSCIMLAAQAEAQHEQRDAEDDGVGAEPPGEHDGAHQRRDEQDRTLAKTVRLWLIDVREVNPPADIELLHWRLVTTHEITDTAKAWQVVGWYQARWVIEQLFRVKKSQGLQLEDSQIPTGDRLVKLAAAATKAACIDMQLVQERDGKDQLPASNVFSEPETETLEALCPTLEGNTRRQQNLHPPASLAWAAWIISRLGGWNCYYKSAGPITMRRGMQQFYSIHRGRQLEMMPKREVRIP